jgi:ABC-type phosphate transport system substrate-binding protein
MTRRTSLVFVFCLVASLPIPVSGQATTDIAVIVHPDIKVDNLSLADLRRILLGDREFWPSGPRVTLLIRAPVARERDAIVKNVCEMTEAQFRQHWIGKVFRAETPSGPKIVYSREMALDQVSRTPGAIALVEAPLAGKAVKVLKIDGKSPGQAGYALK